MEAVAWEAGIKILEGLARVVPGLIAAASGTRTDEEAIERARKAAPTKIDTSAEDAALLARVRAGKPPPEADEP